MLRPLSQLFPLAFSLATIGRSGGATIVKMVGVGFAIAVPFLYAATGFIGIVIAAAHYNVVDKWIGGIDVELESVRVTPGSIFSFP